MSSGTRSTNPRADSQSKEQCDVHAAIDAVWRIESPRLIAGLARITRDVGAAEDLAQDALVAALEQWPASGIPSNPGAWLMAAAKHRAIDLVRRRSLLERKHGELGRQLEEQQEHGTAGTSAWSPDDRYLAFEFHPTERAEIYVMELPSGVPHLVSIVPSTDNLAPSWSRDGKWIYSRRSETARPFKCGRFRSRVGPPFN